MNNYIQEYIQWKSVSHPRAAQIYEVWLNRFFNFVVKKFEQIQIIDIVKFANNLEDRGLSTPTRSLAILALRDFFKYFYLNEKTKLPFYLIQPPEAKSKHYEFLTQEEVDKILDQIKEDTLENIRDKAIISFLSDTGVRVSELLDIGLSDINLQRKNTTILTKKTNQYRVIFWHDETHRLLKKYIEKRSFIKEPYLWLSWNRGFKDFRKITKRSIERIVKKRSIDAGITYKNVVPHSFRHKLAHELLSNGATNEHIRAILGHKSLMSTQHYTELVNPEIEKYYYYFTKRKSSVDNFLEH